VGQPPNPRGAAQARPADSSRLRSTPGACSTVRCCLHLGPRWTSSRVSLRSCLSPHLPRLSRQDWAERPRSIRISLFTAEASHRRLQRTCRGKPASPPVRRLGGSTSSTSRADEGLALHREPSRGFSGIRKLCDAFCGLRVWLPALLRRKRSETSFHWSLAPDSDDEPDPDL